MITSERPRRHRQVQPVQHRRAAEALAHPAPFQLGGLDVWGVPVHLPKFSDV